MTGRVLVLFLEAMEAALLDEWCGDGTLPNLAAVRKRAAGFRLRSSVAFMPDSMLPEVTSGCPVHESGDYHVIAKLHTGESCVRPPTADGRLERSYFWDVADMAGRRVTIADHSWGSAHPDFRGFFITGFGLHHTDVRGCSVPPEAYDDVVARHGPYSVKQCDHNYDFTLAAHERLYADLLAGLKRKEALITERIEAGDWDLLSGTISEAHCAGHQFWYLHDRSHPRHPARVPAVLRDPLRSIYGLVDAALGRLLERVGDDTTVALVAPRGMETLAGGAEILPEFLHRMGLGSGKWLRMKLGFMTPRSAKLAIRRIVPQSILNGMQVGLNSRMGSFAGSTAKVIALDNAGIGGLRLNLAGREPDGCVQPGAEADELLARLRAELSALEHVRGGAPVVERIATPAELFGDDHHQDLPDLFVRFRTDLGVLDRCRSPRLGVFKRPDPPTRTGDHTDHGRMWIAGPGISASRELADAASIDVAPTILDLLDVPPPAVMVGRSVLQAA